jgi:TRAP-type C4-dicarboxylate transport system substrate-binding protein
LAAVAVGTGLPLRGHAQVKMKIKYANSGGAASTAVVFAKKVFAEVTKRTNGEIEFDVFAGTLGGEKTLLDGLALGTVDMTTTAYTGTREFDILYAPYMFRDADHAGKVVNGALRERFSKLMKDRYDAEFMGVARDGPFCLFTKTKIDSFAGIKGMKIRAGEIEGVIAGLQHLGARPTVVAFNEVYTSLQQSLVDGMVTLPNLALVMKFNEVCKYYVTNDFGIGLGKWTVASRVWNRLSPAHRQVVQQTFNELEANDYYAAVQRQAPIDVKKWEEVNGAGTVLTFDAKAAQIQMAPLNEKLANDVFGKGTWEQILKA